MIRGSVVVCTRLTALVALFVVAGVLGVAADAAATPVAVRGFEAESMGGVRKTVSMPFASDGRVVVLGGGGGISRRVDLVATRRLEVTLAGGCSRQTGVVAVIDRRRVARLRVGARSVHVEDRKVALRTGWHSVALRAVPGGTGLRRCARPLIDRLDFLPARASDRVLLGAAMRAQEVADDPTYRSLFLRYFDSLTPENELKMAYVEPRPDVFAFGPPDALVGFAHAAGDAVRGHTLVYGSQLPAWVTNPLVPWTPSSLLAVMRTYITTLMRRYHSQIDTWDVVNEAFNDDGSFRQNVWYDVIGPAYVADAFELAHAADPTARLFYNDLGGELPGPKADAIRAMIGDFKAAGIPIDGVGLEDHTDVPGAPSQDVLQAQIAAYARLGVRVEITELDIGTAADPGSVAARARAQALAYRDQATACWDIAACHRVTTWGLYDGLTWIGTAEAPLLFDANYQPKPALYAVEKALHRPIPPPALTR